MPAFLDRCPTTGQRVQGWVADNSEDDNKHHHSVTCLACARAQLVNPKTGKVMGADDE